MFEVDTGKTRGVYLVRVSEALVGDDFVGAWSKVVGCG